MRDYPVTENLSLTRTDGRLDLTFNRPDRRNSLTHRMMDEIGAVLAVARDDPDLRVVVLRGAGGNFCAGGDLDAMADMPPAPPPGEPDPLVAPYRAYGDVLAALNCLPQAVVAVVEGAAVGGGLGMACCSDVVVARADAKFGMPEPRVGFIPSQIIPFVGRRIGEGHARRLAVTARVIDGLAGVDIGLVHHCCDDDAALDAALAQVLGDILACEPAALATVKRLVLSVNDQSDVAVMDDAADSLAALLRQPAAQAGIDAFMAKRRPPWAG